MPSEFILAIDQGTSGTKTVVFDASAQIVSKATHPLASQFPQVGFVEQNPAEIYQSVLESVKKCLHQFQQNPRHSLSQVKTVGISNQRETFLLWDEQGEPLTNAVVWQCKRSVAICNRLQNTPLEKEMIARTGLIIDPYFSGTKLLWLYENIDTVKSAIQAGKAFFGTVDTWLLFKLTQGASYFTDYTNASRTLLFNINTLEWDDFLLKSFKLNRLNLPQPTPSTYAFGETDFAGLLPQKIQINGMIGDSHAAAFGEGCFTPGTAKATLGTGSSILLNTGNSRVTSKNGMMTTICWSTRERVDYALEGVIVTAGASIKWLRDQLGLFVETHETAAMATAVTDNNGVYLIPAFSGLGAPFWKMDLQGAIVGLTFGADKNHLVRAALESIPYQIKAVISAMEIDSGIQLKELKVDGGITSNRFVMQFLTDILETKVANIGFAEVSALGAAFMAGLEAGVFHDLNHLQKLLIVQTELSPGANITLIQQWYQEWQKHVMIFMG